MVSNGPGGLSDKTVGAIRCSTPGTPQLNERVGADGRLRPLSGREGRQRAAEVIGSRPSAAVREIAEIAGISVGTAHDLRSRIRRGEDPAGPGSRHVPADPVPGSAGRLEVPGNGMILQSLLRDPAMRHTDSGRELLRWLNAHALGIDAWPSLINSVPAHRITTVAKMARRCAQAWCQFTSELELRAQQLEREQDPTPTSDQPGPPALTRRPHRA